MTMTMEQAKKITRRQMEKKWDVATLDDICTMDESEYDCYRRYVTKKRKKEKKK